MRQEMFSIILPVKNGDCTQVKRAIDSVLTQSFPDFEILLIDDGSESSLAREMDQIARTDPRIRIFHMPASGVSGARNFAMDQAHGNIITFLDGDDALSPSALEEAARIFTDPRIDALWGGTRYVSETELTTLLKNRKEVPSRTGELRSRLIFLTPERIHQTRAECIGEPYRFSSDSLDEAGYINRGIAARFLRKNVLDDGRHRFPDGIKMYEDTIWNLEMMECLHIAYVPSVWYYYYNNAASVSNRFQPDAFERITTPLTRIRTMLDLENPLEYAAYTRFLMDSLRYICKCLYVHPEWRPAKDERKNRRDEIYHAALWKEIASSRYLQYAAGRDVQKARLYRLHLLLFYWKLTWKKM